MRSSRKLDETTNFYWARSWLELYPQAGGPLLYFRVSSPKDGLVAKCWDCNNWGAPLLALFEKWLLSAAGGKGFVTVRWCALSPREFHHAATLPS